MTEWMKKVGCLCLAFLMCLGLLIGVPGGAEAAVPSDDTEYPGGFSHTCSDTTVSDTGELNTTCSEGANGLSGPAGYDLNKVMTVNGQGELVWDLAQVSAVFENNICKDNTIAANGYELISTCRPSIFSKQWNQTSINLDAHIVNSHGNLEYNPLSTMQT